MLPSNNWYRKIWTAECEECESVLHNGEVRGCLDCQQTLCIKCDKRIHNKGNRRFHRLVDCTDRIYQDKGEKGLDVFFLSPETDPNYVMPRKNQNFPFKVIRATLEILLRETENGVPMVPLESVISKLTNQFPKMGEKRLNECLEKICEGYQYFNFTKRKFGESKQKAYFSLYLKQISLQAIVWILKSIRNDKMQPLHTLIHSRFKEYFGIKIGQKEWKIFVQRIYEENIKKARNQRGSRKGSQVYSGQTSGYKKHHHHKPSYKKFKYNKCIINGLNNFSGILPELKLRKEDEDTMIWYFAKEPEWEYEDLSQVETQHPDYIAFLEFIENFFKNDNSAEPTSNEESNEEILNNIYKPQEKRDFKDKLLSRKKETFKLPPTPIPADPLKNRVKNLRSLKGFKTRKNLKFKPKKQKSSSSLYNKAPSSDTKSSKKVHKFSPWLSSVERPFQEEKQNASGLEQSAEKLFQGKKVQKAIPGGKYGCALMVKHCGPKQLQEKSLGRILALIKKSLEEGVLVHWKTLLVKNEKSKDSNSQAVEVELKMYQQNVLRLLSKHKDGISLAQFKQYYNKDNPSRPFEFEKLRFAKLTDFLNTMDDWVDISKKLKNNNVVYLKEDCDVPREIMKISRELREMGATNFDGSLQQGINERDGGKKGLRQIFNQTTSYGVNMMHPQKIGPIENHIYQHQRAGARLTPDILRHAFCKFFILIWRLCCF